MLSKVADALSKTGFMASKAIFVVSKETFTVSKRGCPISKAISDRATAMGVVFIAMMSLSNAPALLSKVGDGVSIREFAGEVAVSISQFDPGMMPAGKWVRLVRTVSKSIVAFSIPRSGAGHCPEGRLLAARRSAR